MALFLFARSARGISPPPSFFARDIRRLPLPLTSRTPPQNDLPGIDALQRSALTSALPRAESSEAREDRAPGGDESGDDASEVLAPAPPAAPPPKTLVFDSTLSSERRPSTRPSDVAGEGRAFSTVVASGKVLVWNVEKRKKRKGQEKKKVVASEDSVPFAARSTTPRALLISPNPRPRALKPAPTYPTRRCRRPCPWKSR